MLEFSFLSGFQFRLDSCKKVPQVNLNSSQMSKFRSFRFSKTSRKINREAQKVKVFNVAKPSSEKLKTKFF